MTISTAFNNALQGLRAAGRATDVIASNISNATTQGYARRVIELSSTTWSNFGGVQVTGINRVTDPALTGARRNADADLGYASTISSFLTRLERTLGTPDDPAALTNALNDFDAALLTASSRPDAHERLSVAIESAKSIAETFRSAADAVADMRSQADASIDAQVTRLNDALAEVKQLNTKIAQTNIGGQDDSGLRDIRDRIIDEIHAIVPVNIAARDHGKVALYSQGGLVMLDGKEIEFDFTPAQMVTPYQTREGGQLSGLQVNGIELRLSGRNSHISGGTLAANFAVRDVLGTDAQAQIDAAARNLVERFQDPAVDPTLGLTDAGLFTDGGSMFDPANEIGLSQRLQINAAVDPDRGGEVWRLRDGINAATPGPAGQTAIIDALRETLNDRILPASGDFGTGALSASGLASGLMSRIGVQRLSAEQSLTFAAASQHETAQAERAFGVDTDAELQMLILVEQNYAANARMIETINDMMDTLMRIGQ